jgi:hypothetical protein
LVVWGAAQGKLESALLAFIERVSPRVSKNRTNTKIKDEFMIYFS